MPSPDEIMIELRFHPTETCFPVRIPDLWKGSTQEEGECPTYVARGTFDFRGKTYMARTYYFYFTDNLATGCGWRTSPKAESLGYHPHDVEKATILLDSNHLPSWVYFSAHSRGQGQWVSWEDCEKTEEGYLIVYVARGSHAFYPSAGYYIRLFGLANDVCKANGKAMLITSYNPAVPWKSENGIELSASIPPLPQTSVSAWQRLCIPFYADWLRNKMV